MKRKVVIVQQMGKHPKTTCDGRVDSRRYNGTSDLYNKFGFRLQPPTASRLLHGPFRYLFTSQWLFSSCSWHSGSGNSIRLSANRPVTRDRLQRCAANWLVTAFEMAIYTEESGFKCGILEPGRIFSKWKLFSKFLSCSYHFQTV